MIFFTNISAPKIKIFEKSGALRLPVYSPDEKNEFRIGVGVGAEFLFNFADELFRVEFEF